MLTCLDWITLIIFLISIVLLVVFKENRISNMVRILLNQGFKLPAVCIIRAIFIEMKGYCCTLLASFCLFNLVTALTITCPLESLLFTCLSGDNLNFLSNHESGVETNTELTNEVRILLLLICKGREELLCTGRSNGSKVIIKICFIHSKAIISNCKDFLITIKCDVDLRIEAITFKLFICKREILQLIDCIRCITDQLTKEDLPV